MIEEEEKIKGNTTIDKFMNLNLSYYPSNVLQYDSSWDWLMPVIVKITDLPECQEYKKVTGYEQINIYPNCIDDTWIEVVEFTEWYNSTHISSDMEQEDKHKQMTIFDIDGV